MSSRKVYLGMIGLLALSIVGMLGALLLGNQALEKKSSELMDLKIQSHLLDEQQTSLSRAAKDVQTYAELESIAKTIVPKDKDQARTVREIVAIAESSGISFSDISFP